MLGTDLSGRAALVTGSGQGIGRGIAELLAEHGAAVAVNDINRDTAAAAVAAIEAKGGRAVAMPGDVSRGEDVRGMVEGTERTLGAIDILVNNAAYMSMMPLVDLPEEEWDRVLDVDLKGQYLTCRAVVPGMLARGWGRIINIASGWGVTGAPGATHYSAAKAGVIGFTRALAQEVTPQGLTVNAIAPGIIDTPQLAVDAGYAGRPLERMKEVYLQSIPAGRLGRPRDIALTVLMLCIEIGDFYSGQVFMPNGGEY